MRTAIDADRSPTHATFVRRRLVAVGVLLALAFVLTVMIGRVGAEAELADPVAGHVVLEPGQTLWDVAVATAPQGVDVREQLADLRELNATDGRLDAWSTVLIPAR